MFLSILLGIIVGLVISYIFYITILSEKYKLKGSGIDWSDKTLSQIMSPKAQELTIDKQYNTIIRKIKSEVNSKNETLELLQSITTISQKLNTPKSTVLATNANDIIELYNMTSNSDLRGNALTQLTVINDTLIDDLDRAKLPGTDSYVKEQLEINARYLSSAKDT